MCTIYEVQLEPPVFAKRVRVPLAVINDRILRVAAKLGLDTLELRSVAAKWGPLGLTGDGTLALDKEMQPVVALSLAISGFAETLDALVASGLVDQKKAGLPRVILGALARNNNGTTSIKAPLTIQDGFLLIGPVKLLPVPPIDW